MLCEWHLKAQALSAHTGAKNSLSIRTRDADYRNRGIRYPIYFRDSDQPNLYILLYMDVFRKIPRSENSECCCPPFFKPIVLVPLLRSSRSQHPIEGLVTGLTCTLQCAIKNFFFFFESICILAYSSVNKPGCSYKPLHL
jgi:hypothetical protein